MVIEVRGLVKKFGNVHAVNHLDLDVQGGTVYSLLGPNGVGKTTTIRILSTLLKPDAGIAKVLGYDLIKDARKLRELITLTGQLASVDDDLTGHENITILGGLLGMTARKARQRSMELLEAFDLAGAADRQVKLYSGGMRRRLDIAASFIRAPRILFLDEPTTGLDPQSRSRVWSIVRTLVRNGTTVLLTTQYLEEADQLSDRIAVINHGRVIAEGTSDELKCAFGRRSLRLRFPSLESVTKATCESTVELRIDPDNPLVRSVDATDAAHAFRLLDQLSQGGAQVLEFYFERPSLDEIFLSLTQASTGGLASPSVYERRPMP